MFDTNDVFNDAVRGSTLHTDASSVKSLIGSKVVAMLLLTSIAVVGFKFYSPINSVDNDLVVKNQLLSKNEVVVKNELVAKIQTKAELLVVEKFSDSEKSYLSALRGIETELTEEKETVNLNTQVQLDLSSAMSNLVDDSLLADTSNYTNELKKEIGVELDNTVENSSVIVDNSKQEESRTVVVKKGDTLRGLSNKFYGDELNYKRIIASNASLNSNDIIYEGQTIILPY
jgi:LysM repeat protein